MHLIQNTLISMDDGVKIAVDIYLPARQGKYPAVFYFGPYRKDDFFIRSGAGLNYAELYAQRGFAFVCGDVRGVNDSEGITRRLWEEREQKDGAAIVEWIAAQQWCNQNVGMTGTSYGFFTSLLTAAQQPQHLKTVVPLYGSVSSFYGFAENGVPQTFGYHADYVGIMLAMQGSPPGFRDSDERWRDIWEQRLQNLTPWGIEWFDRQLDDDYWRPSSVRHVYDRINIPVFAIGAWWDRYPDDTLALYNNLKAPVKILIGPWQHSRPDLAIPGPRLDYDVVLRWFDYWLKGESNGVMDEPRVTFFAQRYAAPASYRQLIPGAWRTEPTWPIDRTVMRRWFLAEQNQLQGEAPQSKGVDAYRYDPTAGVCSGLSGGIYGGIAMPVDQRPDEAKSVIFTSAPLTEEIEVTGIPTVGLHFASTARTMDVIAKLCDVAPDGTVSLVTRAYLNVAHRGGFDKARLLRPGEIYPLMLAMKSTSYVFEPQHRIRLAITSAEFPTAFPTPEPGTNQVLYGGSTPSWVELPVIPKQRPMASEIRLKELAPPPIDPPTNNCYEVHTDQNTGESTATREVSKQYPGLDGQIEWRQSTVARVHPDRPAEARVESRASFQFSYQSGERCTSVGQVICHGDVSSIHVDASLRISLNGLETYKRDWAHSFPRKFI
jgi:putative CocE/NonD family hydrolase